MKILTSEQLKAGDKYTIEHEPISSIDLMERASRAFVTWFIQRFTVTQRVGVVCGTGNNGGDGLAIARLLLDWGYLVKVWVVRGDAKTSEDFNINLARLNGKTDLYEITTAADQGLFHDRQVLIDAVFGSGLSRSPEGIYAQVISCINKTMATRVAVDIPSGLLMDGPSAGPAVKADFTISFQVPKLSFMLPENYQYVGRWELVDIGMSKKFLKELVVSNFLITRESAKKRLKPRLKFDHKGDHGRGLLISGSFGKMGACILGARAALRSGIGLLTVHVPLSAFPIIQSAVPEAMATMDRDEKTFTDPGAMEMYDVIGVGPGIGKDVRTASALLTVLRCGKPMIIDADALNIIAERREWLKEIPAGSILTPHPKEFERLVGGWSNDFERLEKQKALAIESRSVVVLKGAHSSVVGEENVFFNSTGNPGMATGGTGDVLTGMLTGLLAQGYSAMDAAILGVYLHGLAGDMAAHEKGVNSLVASDVIDQIPAAFGKIT